MALNRVYAAKLPAIVREVAPGIKSGDFLMIEDRPVVALTDRGDATKTTTLGDYTITHPSGGASLKGREASLYVDGTYDLPVDGVDDETISDVPVYYHIDNGPKLTLTDTGTLFGYTNYPPENYARKDGIAPVRIGA